MKPIKGGNLLRLVAFFVIAAILTCTASFAAGGWQSFIQEEPDSDNTADTTLPDGEVDENTDGSSEETVIPTPPPEIKHYLTGVTVTPDRTKESPISFIYSCDAPLYGISSAFLTLEIPTENGQTRYVSLFDFDTYLGKIGSITPSRDYIDNITSALGSNLVHRGNDDSFSYSDGGKGGIDILENSGYSYTEYTEYHYTNSDLVKAMIKNCGIKQIRDDSVKAPFIHSETEIKGKDTALSVIIPYSDTNTTQLVYSAADGKYTLSKGASEVKDLLNDKICAYDNAFVLFADATTYETANATETVFDTKSGGEGYYFTRGTAFKITWSQDKDGNLVFHNENGGILLVNVGTSYIAFEKSSHKSFILYN